MSIKSQLLKGILEGCMLAIIEKKSVYGYELSMKLQKYGLTVSEGSIYPVLLRMQKNKLIEGVTKPSSNGPNRKYYHLTAEGILALESFQLNWLEITQSVEQILKEENNT
ncbi:MAG TPA: PadR family transcriptional regulator [Pseudogracilibacillus sp.]|nr:PadR family transcriptional regulator [Pseudogracilibacillus sp.]